MPRPGGVYRFGPFELDTVACRLVRDGSPLDVPPRLLDLLGLLVARPGELVTKQELIDALWPGVFVTDNSLTRAVSDLRRALGDSPDHPSYIRTVARRGYRFAGNVDARARGAPLAQAAAMADPVVLANAWTEGRLHLESLSRDALPRTRAAFEHARAVAPHDARIRVALANACLLEFQATRCTAQPDRAALDRAVAEAREACALDATMGEAWATLGFALASAGLRADALAYTRRAVELEPDSWRHRFRHAFAAWGEERLREVQRATALYPSLPFAHFLSAMVFIARGALDAAQRALDEGVAARDAQAGRSSVFPGAGLHWLRGVVRATLGSRDAALDDLAREIDLEATGSVYSAEFVGDALVTRGALCLEHGDRAGAAAAFTEALQRLPGLARAHLGLAAVLGARGETNAAREEQDACTASIDRLEREGRAGEAVVVRACGLVLDGRPAEAASMLEAHLIAAPAGFDGWIVPVEPFLRSAIDTPAFSRVRAILTERAA